MKLRRWAAVSVFVILVVAPASPADNSVAPIKIIEKHTSAVNSIAFSPDGKCLASGGLGAVRIYDTASWRELSFVNAGGYFDALSIQFSPDGRLLAAGGSDNTIKIWSAVDATEITSLEGHSAPVQSIDFSPDGSLLASAGKDGYLKIWDARVFSSVEVILDAVSPVHCTAFSPDGKMIAAGYKDGHVRVWDTVEWKKTSDFAVSSSVVRSVRFSPDNRTLVSGGDDKRIALCELREHVPVKYLSARGRVCSISFSPDGRYIAAGADDKLIYVWETAGWSLMQMFKAHAECVKSISFSPNGEYLSSAGNDTDVKVWDFVRLIWKDAEDIYGLCREIERRESDVLRRKESAVSALIREKVAKLDELNRTRKSRSEGLALEHDLFLTDQEKNAEAEEYRKLRAGVEKEYAGKMNDLNENWSEKLKEETARFKASLDDFSRQIHRESARVKVAGYSKGGAELRIVLSFAGKEAEISVAVPDHVLEPLKSDDLSADVNFRYNLEHNTPLKEIVSCRVASRSWGKIADWRSSLPHDTTEMSGEIKQSKK